MRMTATGRDTTILVIEDDEATRDVLELLLGSAGYQVRVANIQPCAYCVAAVIAASRRQHRTLN